MYCTIFCLSCLSCRLSSRVIWKRATRLCAYTTARSENLNESGKIGLRIYCERLEQYFVANDVDDGGKQRAILLSVCGATTYQLIRNLVAPAKPTERTFGELRQVGERTSDAPSVRHNAAFQVPLALPERG